MRTFEWATAAYFAYLLVLAWIRPLPANRRWQITGASAALLALLWAGSASGRLALLRDWLPLLYVLIGYWLSGRFFTRPMERIEERLAAADRRLFAALDLPARLDRAPRVVLEFLEAMYFAAPAFLLAGFLIVIGGQHAHLVDRYWTIVLLSEFGAFAVLPWVQTRPPWAVDPPGVIDRRAPKWRRINRRMTIPLQIRVNTFPSGHASGTLAVAFVLLEAAPPAGLVFLALALSVCVASVTGRYHYAVDVIAGAATAMLAATVGRLITS
jgi:membrane-associated phospholipid phosphatase